MIHWWSFAAFSAVLGIGIRGVAAEAAGPVPRERSAPAADARIGPGTVAGAGGQREPVLVLGTGDQAVRGEAPGETLTIEEARRSDGIPATASYDALHLEAYAARALHTGDLLERLAGVDVQHFGGTGQGSFVRIRGSSPSQVLVLVDGVRVNPISGGGADLDAIPVELLERVEVARGAGASRFGADALGGVVAFRSDPEAKHGAASMSAGSTGTVRSSASAVVRRHGWSMDATARQERVADRFRYRDDLRGEDRTRVNAGTQSFGGSAGARGPVAGGRFGVRLWATGLEGGSPGLSEFPTPEARREERRATLVAQWEREGLFVDASQRLEGLRYDDPTPILGSEPVHAASRGTASSASLSFRRAVSPGTAIVAGFDGRQEGVRDRLSGWHSRWVGGAHGEMAGTLAGGRIETSLGLRYEGVWERRGEDGAPEMKWMPLPSAGIAWNVTDALRVRAHGGRAYRIPTFQELWLPDLETVGGNPALRPEDAWTGDVGIAFRPPDESTRVSVEGALFGTVLREGILFAPVSPYRFGPVNTGPAWIGGGELSGMVDFAGIAEFRAAYTRTETMREETGDPLPGRPRDRLISRAAARPFEALRTFVEISWSSDSYADFFGNLTAPGGERVAAGITASPAIFSRAGFSLTLEAHNLTNSDVRDSRFFPLPGRTFWLTLAWRDSRETASTHGEQKQ